MLELFDASHEGEPLPVAVRGRDGSVLDLPGSFERHLDPVSADEVGSVYGIITADGSSSDERLRPEGVSLDPPVVPADELDVKPVRRTFVDRLYGYYRWSKLRASDPDFADLQNFHSREKMTLLAHDPSTKDELGRLLADRDQQRLSDFLETYGRSFMDVLGTPSTRRRHQNVLEHLFGYLSELLPGEKRSGILDHIHAFGRGETPLLDPLGAVKKEFEDRSIEWVSNQSYLNPTRRQVQLKGLSAPTDSDPDGRPGG